MNTVLVLSLVSALGQGLSKEDTHVIEAACLGLLADKEFRSTASRKGSKLVLLDTTPEKVGFLSATQIEADISPRRLDPLLIERLWERNHAGEGWECRKTSYRGLGMDPRISIGKLPKKTRGSQWDLFEKSFPRAIGWFQPYLPAYSENLRLAVVRGYTGPSPHGATATVLLRRIGDRWVPEWVRISRYV